MISKEYVHRKNSDSPFLHEIINENLIIFEIREESYKGDVILSLDYENGRICMIGRSYSTFTIETFHQTATLFRQYFIDVKYELRMREDGLITLCFVIPIYDFEKLKEQYNKLLIKFPYMVETYQTLDDAFIKLFIRILEK